MTCAALAKKIKGAERRGRGLLPARCGFGCSPLPRKPRHKIKKLRRRRSRPVQRKTFQNVAHFHVREIRNADSALKPAANFVSIVLKALQRNNPAGINDRIIPQHAHFRIALDDAILHIRPGNHPGTLDAESIPHFSPAQINFLDHRREQPGHSLLQFVAQLVNNRVQPNINAFLLRQISSLSFRANPEPDDDGARRRSQQDVRFGNSTHAGMNNFELHLVGRKFREHLAQALPPSPARRP